MIQTKLEFSNLMTLSKHFSNISSMPLGKQFIILLLSMMTKDWVGLPLMHLLELLDRILFSNKAKTTWERYLRNTIEKEKAISVWKI